MASISEVGHGKNVANLEDVISMCVGFGPTYNPSNNSLKIAGLTALKTNGDTVMTGVTNSYSTLKLAVNDRELAFEPLKTLSSRVMAALKASGANKLIIKDAQTFVNKIQGRRGKQTLADAGKQSAGKGEGVSEGAVVSVPDEDKVRKQHSTSQLSFDSKMEHFTGVISLVSAVPVYGPNETDLKVAGLNVVVGNMKAKNTAVINAFTGYTNALAARNKVLYAEGTGLVDVALLVKEYVKSIYGASSSQYKAVNKISFRNLDR